jgi:hypothetical protein
MLHAGSRAVGKFGQVPQYRAVSNSTPICT